MSSRLFFSPYSCLLSYKNNLMSSISNWLQSLMVKQNQYDPRIWSRSTPTQDNWDFCSGFLWRTGSKDKYYPDVIALPVQTSNTWKNVSQYQLCTHECPVQVGVSCCRVGCQRWVWQPSMAWCRRSQTPYHYHTIWRSSAYLPRKELL